MSQNLLTDAFVYVFMFFTRIIVQSYTYATLPFYYVCQKPWRRRAIAGQCGAKQTDPTDPASEWVRQVDIPFHPLMECQTAAEAFDKIFELYPLDKPALGYRDVLAEEVQLDREGRPIKIDGKVLRKYKLSDYKWLTLQEVGQRIDDISQGLMASGLKNGDRVAIYAETSVQWFLMSAALTKMGAVMVTVFHTLSDDGLIHAINETEVSYIITSFELITRVSALSPRLPTIRTVVYFEGPKKELNYNFRPDISVLSLSELETIGNNIEPKVPLRPSKPEDVCLIMYTSGTSGLPKGVIGTQQQLKEAAMAMGSVVRDVIMEGPRHTYIAYLPQAHILEATIELFLFIGGVKIGFATPFTLNESAPGLAKGTVCDLQLLRPTIMTTVPLVLDRIRKEMFDKLRDRTAVSTDIFNYLIEYKAEWIQKGYSTPILNSLLCPQVRQQLGGKLEYMVVGSAPLSPQLQSLIKCSVDVTLIHGYGTTETCGAVLCQDFNDLSFGRVGAPLNGVKIKLRNWTEGGYSIDDFPHPRGEIVVGGHMVSNGYFKLDSLTQQSFYRDSNGINWFLTGDIGEVYTDGTFRIIDRKRDLIKLSNGEFVSLAKIESALRNDRFVDNICIFGDAIVNQLVALVQPNRKSLDFLCKQLAISDDTPFDQICTNDEVVNHIHNSMRETAVKQQLHRKEIPSLVTVCCLEWTPDNGLMTAAMKLRRTAIMDKYREDIHNMFRIIKSFNKSQNICNL